MDHNLFTMQLLCLYLKSHIWRGFTRPALPVTYSTGKVTTTSSSRNNGKSHRRGVITVAIHTAIKNRDGVSRERYKYRDGNAGQYGIRVACTVSVIYVLDNL